MPREEERSEESCKRSETEIFDNVQNEMTKNIFYNMKENIFKNWREKSQKELGKYKKQI